VTLAPGPGSANVLRELPRAKAQSRREGRRRSLAYFAHLTDFQLADEESPARVQTHLEQLIASGDFQLLSSALLGRTRRR